MVKAQVADCTYVHIPYRSVTNIYATIEKIQIGLKYKATQWYVVCAHNDLLSEILHVYVFVCVYSI